MKRKQLMANVQDPLPQTPGPDKKSWLFALACACSLAANSAFSWVLNNGIFPVTCEALPEARELQTFMPIIMGAALFAAAWRYPKILRPFVMTVFFCICTAGGALILALVPQTPVGAAMGLAIWSLGRAWNFYLACLGLSLLGTGRLPIMAAVTSVLATSFVTSWIAELPYTVSLLLGILFSAIPPALLYHPTYAIVEAISQGPGASDLAVTNPWSFLSISHQVFALICIFSIASGFSLSFNIASFTPLATPVLPIILILVLSWFSLASRRPGSEDSLLILSFLLVVAGFMLATLKEPALGALANSLLSAGRRCFDVLSWTVLATLCARNVPGSIFVLSCGSLANSTGTFIGADLGHLTNALGTENPLMPSLVIDAVLFGLIAYVLLALRGFSFARTIGAIVPVATEQPAPSHSELMEQAAASLANAHGLTDREQEVMLLLARGHNSSHIQQVFTLSYNTVKTHVKRIYRKLDVHSQQELIDLVETTINHQNT